MAILGKLFRAGPGMSSPRMAPRPAPVVSRPPTNFLTGGLPKQTLPINQPPPAIGAPVPPPPSSIGKPLPPMSIGGPGGGMASALPVGPSIPFTPTASPLPVPQIGAPNPNVPIPAQLPDPTVARPAPSDEVAFVNTTGSPKFSDEPTSPLGGDLPIVPPAQPLPIFGPGDLDLSVKENRPNPRDFAKQLPGGGTIYDDPTLNIPDVTPGVTPPSVLAGKVLPPSPETLAGLEKRQELNKLSQQRQAGSSAFFEAFPDAPQMPQMQTADMQLYKDPFTGEMKQGSSTQIGYINQLKKYLDENPAAMESYTQNVLAFNPPPSDQGPILGRPTPPMSIGGPGGGQTDPRVFTGGSPTFDERGETFVPPSTVAPTPDPVVEPTPTPTPDPVATTTGDPATPSPTETIPTPPGTVDPVIMGQVADARISDPLLRPLYFGTPDQPGFYNQLQQVGANLLGAQAPGTEYDPSMTEKFFNPFEDQVVQQTIEDVIKAGEQRDIAQRAQDIGRGGLSAFGSRARLTASERQEDLGRGLAKALAGIRQSGFSEAQRTGLSEFDRQYGRDINQLYRPLNILQGIGGLLPGYQAAGTQLRTTYGMPADPSALGLGAALGAYSSLAPQTGSVFDNYGQTTGQG